MHLDNKSLLLLSSPFILATGIWFFAADSLVQRLQYFFESIQQQRSSVLDEKRESYTFITGHHDEYESLLKKIRIRHENRFWVSERLYQPYLAQTTDANTQSQGDLGLKAPPPLLQFGEGNITSQAPTWSVQMVLPDQNIAVINNQIYHVGQSTNGVKLLSVETSKIHIQTAKGSQWVKLFH
jgi:hypothetical protein